MRIKIKIKAFISALIIMLSVLGGQPAVVCSEEMQTIKVAMSEDESIIVERILYTALKQLGYQMITKTAGMRTTVSDVNYGDAAIVPAQTEGLDEEYPNLIKVPVPISFVEINAYTRREEPYLFSSWGELEGLRLCHRWQNLYVTKNVPRAMASEVVTLNDYEDLWKSLLAFETDVAVIPNLTGYVRITPHGVKLAGVIERQPRYTYVNKDYEYLVPLLTEVYRKMTDDGTMELIRNSRQTGDKPIVLHISSYNVQSEWERNEMDAIRKSLDINPRPEYKNLNLNAHQIQNKANTSAVIAATIRSNFIERNPDLIIASDNDALEFVLSNYYMLFPKVPVVFCGINNFDASMLYGFEEYVTGVTETLSIKETITEMLQLYPGTKRIYILNDYSHCGLEWHDRLQKCIDSNDFSVEFEFNQNKPFIDILKEVSGFDSQTLVLIGSYFVDSDNAYYSEREIQELICEASKMPVFCLTDSFNGYGTLGGMVSVGEVQGRIAGDIAGDILGGILPFEVPIITDSESLNRWQFDYEVARLFEISDNSLPAGYTVVNRILPIWESNPLEFRLALIFAFCFSIIIFGLILFLRLMRKKNYRLMEMQSHLHSAEELLEKDNDLRKMIDSLPVSVLIVDILTCKPEYSNQAFLTANGFDSLEQVNQIDLSPIMRMASTLWKDRLVSFNFGSLRQPDSEICQRVSTEKLMYRDKNCFIFISEDITAQLKENEMLTRAAQKEKEANMLKGRFLANMSHEIRTPMNAIIGLTQLALLKKQTSENESFFYNISTSAKNLLSIINDILDFSKIEAEKIELTEEKFELEDVISGAFTVVSNHLDNKLLEILLDIKPNVPCFLYGDSTRLWQVLKNILDNSAKYTKVGQVLMTVEVLDASSDRISLNFRICDTGIGMTPEQLSRLFTPFERFHNNDFKTKSVGTGLGMSITKELVELMDGSIEVHSKVNEGSEFSVTIPFKLSSDTKTIGDFSRSCVEMPSDSVLLVDDNTDSLRIMSSLLEHVGIPAVIAHNSAEAFEMLEQHTKKEPGLTIAIIDNELGTENGLDTAKKIHELNRDVRILLMTGNAKQSISSQQLEEAGIEDIIEKPFTVSAFMQKMSGKKTEILIKQKDIAKYSGAKVLLCEDNEINQIVAESMLNEFGIEPVIASNGREALDILETQAFDLIFMDILMPVLDGHETTVAIRQSGKPYKDTPICALTANVMVDDVQQCMDEGVNAHLKKPLSFDALADVLNNILAPFQIK